MTQEKTETSFKPLNTSNTVLPKPNLDKAKTLTEVKQKRLDAQFLDAVKNSKIEDIRWLLSLGADPNVKEDENGKTALMNAAWMGGTDICTLLIEKGAKIDAKDDEGWTPLMYAAWDGHTEICKLLLDKLKESGGDVRKYMWARNKYHRTAFLFAAELRDFKTCEFLLDTFEKEGSDLESFIEVTDSGEKITHFGCDIKSFIEATDSSGDTVLSKLAYQGKTEMCAFLLEKIAKYGGDVKDFIKASPGGGWTAIRMAEENNQKETATFLKAVLSSADPAPMLSAEVQKLRKQ